jgi:Tol biopolymer transport system component
MLRVSSSSFSWSPLGLAVLITACEGPVLPETHADPLPPAFAVVPGAPWGAASSVDLGGLQGINTAATEGCPIESPDSRSLYFASNRAGQLDLWVSTRNGRGDWGAPERLPDPINTLANDFCPTPLPGGGLMFVSTRDDGLNCGDGTSDIYQTHILRSGGWAEPQHLGCTVNGDGDEFSPSYVPAGGGMLFFSSNASGVFRIYLSHRGIDGSWQAPTEVSELNLDGYDTSRPNVSADGRVIVFDSNRPGGLGGFDIWAAHRQTLDASWSDPVNLGDAVNSNAGESRATMSRDGRRLLFGSTRSGFEGASDLFVSERH